MASPSYRGTHRQAVPPPQQAAALLPGRDIVGRYRLGERTAPEQPVTFRAEDRLLRRPVVVTFINLDSNIAELIYGSADQLGLSALGHPSLARLLDVGHEPDVRESFIVSDFLSDTTLADLLDSGTASPEDLRRVLPELAHLILYLRRSGFGRRTLDPDNIRVAQRVVSSRAPIRIQVGLAGLQALTESAPPDGPRASREDSALTGIAHAIDASLGSRRTGTNA